MVTIIGPVMIPADLIPAMARPRMNAGELGAATQVTDPASNTMMEWGKVHLRS